MERQALEQVMAASGVKVTAEDVGAIARALARVEAAARLLSSSPTFDTSVDEFTRVLESGAATTSGR